MTTKSTEETKSATGSPDEGLPPAVSVTKVTDTKAREDASRMQAELERERQERAALEVRLARIEKEREEAELKAMQPDERVHRQISDLSAQVQKSQEQMRQQQLFFEGQLRAMNLVAYRERALRDLGDIPESFTSFVQGADEKSIDLAVDQVRRAWKDVQERLVQRTLRILRTPCLRKCPRQFPRVGFLLRLTLFRLARQDQQREDFLKTFGTSLRRRPSGLGATAGK